MKNSLYIFWSLVITLSPAIGLTADSDPYSAIEYIKLDNGLEVFLAPSAEATMADVKLKVKVGTEVESKKYNNIGISHLLEHVLFRDRGLKDEMTYLQLIKEAGGSANGSTSSRETTYFGSIPPEKAPWLLETIGKMVLNPTIEEDMVQKEKGTVELERGRPGPVTLALGFNPMDYIYPPHLRKPDFWKTEFNLSFEENYNLTEEQLSTRKLSAEQVKQHYQDYYYPSNMQLFVSGKYDKSKILALINSKWASLPNSGGKTLPPQKKPEPRMKPLLSQQISYDNASVYLGTKVINATLFDQEVLSAYTEYLSHRLMKEIRNLKGQTYSARPNTYVLRGFGYTYVYFETPKENLEDNYNLAKKYISSEAEQGNLSDEDVQKAKELYLAQYKLKGRESQNMLGYAEIYASILEEHGKFTSPYLALSSITPQEFNASLKKHFTPSMHYETVFRPPLVFQYDHFFLFSAFAILSFVGFRQWLTKSFANDHIRWIRNVKYPPLKALEFFTFFVAIELILHVNAFYDKIIYSSNTIQSSILYSVYLSGMVEIFYMIVIGQGVLSLLPRKLMIMDNKLLIKSVSYYSHEIPVDNIVSVKAVRAFSYLKWAWAVKHRFYFYDLLFWRKGLLINLKDGRSYFFSVRDADKAAAELSGFVKRDEVIAVDEKAA